jgi:glutaredoxin-like protein
MVEKLLNEAITDQVRQAFDGLKDAVDVLYFGSQDNCVFCEDTHQLLEEVTGLSDKIKLSVYDIHDRADMAEKYHVDKSPGLVILGRNGDELVDYGIRFAGIPSGHEFSSLIESLLLVSGRDSGLNQATRDFLKTLSEPLLLQVFVTPTCPYCPQAVVLAHRMALESPQVEAEMVEAVEFPELSERFGVSGVPHTVIDAGAGALVGAAPEEHLVAEIRRAMK